MSDSGAICGVKSFPGRIKEFCGEFPVVVQEYHFKCERGLWKSERKKRNILQCQLVLDLTKRNMLQI